MPLSLTENKIFKNNDKNNNQFHARMLSLDSSEPYNRKGLFIVRLQNRDQVWNILTSEKTRIIIPKTIGDSIIEQYDGNIIPKIAHEIWIDDTPFLISKMENIIISSFDNQRQALRIPLLDKREVNVYITEKVGKRETEHKLVFELENISIRGVGIKYYPFQYANSEMPREFNLLKEGNKVVISGRLKKLDSEEKLDFGYNSPAIIITHRNDANEIAFKILNNSVQLILNGYIRQLRQKLEQEFIQAVKQFEEFEELIQNE